MAVDPRKQTSLHCLYYWAEETPDNVYLTQPYPDGRVEDITWKQAAHQVSRMAAYLNSLELPEPSNISILGKNSAHWILADLEKMYLKVGFVYLALEIPFSLQSGSFFLTFRSTHTSGSFIPQQKTRL